MVMNMNAAQGAAILQSSVFLMGESFRGGGSAMREPKFARTGAGFLTVDGVRAGYAFVTNVELENCFSYK